MQKRTQRYLDRQVGQEAQSGLEGLVVPYHLCSGQVILVQQAHPFHLKKCSFYN